MIKELTGDRLSSAGVAPLILILEQHIGFTDHSSTSIVLQGNGKEQSAYAKTKAQTSFAVNVKLISAFVFATYTQTVLSLVFLNPKSQASSLLL